MPSYLTNARGSSAQWRCENSLTKHGGVFERGHNVPERAGGAWYSDFCSKEARGPRGISMDKGRLGNRRPIDISRFLPS